MIETKNVRGCTPVLRLEYGKDTVYVRSNIHTVEVDGETQAEYDEKAYTYAEWFVKQNGDINDINDALIELAEIIGG